MDLQHDGNAVGVALLGENSIRDEAACVGVFYLGGVASVLEGSFGDGLESLGGVLFVCPDADIRGWGVGFYVLLRDNPVGVAVHVNQQDPGMAVTDIVHSSVVFVVVFQGFLFQVRCDVFDGGSVICLFIAEAHAVLFHRFLFPDEAFHIAEQAADLEVFAHIPAAVGPRNSPDDICVPHFMVVFFELIFGDDDGALEFFREPVSVMRDMEDRKAGYGFKVLSGDGEEFLGGVEAAPGGQHGRADERFD